MGLISRVSSRTYRTENMADGDVEEKRAPEKAIDRMTTKDLDKLSSLQQEMETETNGDDLLETLNKYYEERTKKQIDENNRLKELKKVETNKDHVAALQKHWQLSKTDALRILREHGGDVHKAMYTMATS